jgi:probable rRNA maturation factor
VTVSLYVRNESACKRLCQRRGLQQIAQRICEGEGVRDNVEVSVLLCDDALIQSLNREYRGKDRPTDVLAFCQEAAVPGHETVCLGDIVISLETVGRNCAGDRAAMRDEARLMLCHGLLHLLGHDHATECDRKQMAARQAQYLGLSSGAAWPEAPKPRADAGSGRARKGGMRHFGR